ncbi:hypothetical protein PBY51_005758 [Eleginops maclovinus]|uniref:Immunoglobulin domain-containing protein n=1 Tax=Eleginops maclovinus TaxID=56733 RepID=A0AAN8A0D1_ELEMC|nr:hypothetical protein PBY51_005758 [Eleginops maclovinus]
MISATLVIRPDRSQFFKYETVNLISFPSDTGVYWCQSLQGACSNTINISVNDGGVILGSPTFPVTVGDEVVLHCSYKAKNGVKATSDFSAAFYKNNTFIGNQPGGKLTLQNVSKSDEGFYRCEHPKGGKSLPSRLAVKDRPTDVSTPPPPPVPLARLLCSILLFITFTVIFIVCIYIFQRWARARAHA